MASPLPLAALSDEALLHLIQCGDRAAVGELYGRYAARLRAAVAGARGPALCDPEDVVQSAFRSFIEAAERGRYRVPDGADLWALLVTIALNKRRSHARRATAAKRAPGAAPRPSAAHDDPGAALGARDLLDRLPSPEREIAELRLAGCSVDEIAGRLGRSRRTVERNLHSCRERLLKEGTPDE